MLLRDPLKNAVIPIVEELRRRLPPANIAQQVHGDDNENLNFQHDGVENDGTQSSF